MSVNTPEITESDDDSERGSASCSMVIAIPSPTTRSPAVSKSYDYGTDGAAVEIYNGDRNTNFVQRHQ